MNILSLEELKEKRKGKLIYKTDYMGLSKVGSGYLQQLQDTAEHNANEAASRKWNLINIYKKLSKKVDKYIKTNEELENLSCDDLMDYITDMLC